MTFPITAKLDNSIKVEIHLHEFFLGDRFRQCWTFITSGLAAHGQREMTLSLLIEDDGDVNNFPKTPIKLFELLADRTRIGSRVDYGDATLLGQKGIFSFPCLFYAPAIQFPELPSLQGHLSLILVHQSEYEYARRYGVTRFLTRLGKYCSSFPYPTWNTAERPQLFEVGHREESLLADHFHDSIEDAAVQLQGTHLQLLLQPAGVEKVKDALQRNAVLNTAFSVNCDASLFWQPGQDGTGAYADPEAISNCLGGSFLQVTSGNTSGFSIIEDGFLLQLNDDASTSFMRALELGTDTSVDCTHNRKFSIQITERRPSARRYVSVAAWQRIDADASMDDSLNLPPQGVVKAQPFVNLTGEKSLPERVDARELQAYLDRITEYLNAAMAEERERFSIDLKLTMQSDKVDVKITSDIELNPAFSQYVMDCIREIPTCEVTAQIMIQLPLLINHSTQELS